MNTLHRTLIIATLAALLSGCTASPAGNGFTARDFPVPDLGDAPPAAERPAPSSALGAAIDAIGATVEQFDRAIAMQRAQLEQIEDADDRAETERLIDQMQQWRDAFARPFTAVQQIVADNTDPQTGEVDVVRAAGETAAATAPLLPPPWNLIVGAAGAIATGAGVKLREHRKRQRTDQQLGVVSRALQDLTRGLNEAKRRNPELAEALDKSSSHIAGQMSARSKAIVDDARRLGVINPGA